MLVPGGFAYGDYLRTGAIARFSPVMQAVQRFAAEGGLVLGICNGFQILTEAGLLPGALMRNAGLKYICKQVHLRVETANSPFTNSLSKGDVLQIPIGHMDGNYFCDGGRSAHARVRGSNRLSIRHPSPGEVHIGSEPQWLIEQHCGHPEREEERPGHDAASRSVE